MSGVAAGTALALARSDHRVTCSRRRDRSPERVLVSAPTVVSGAQVATGTRALLVGHVDVQLTGLRAVLGQRRPTDPSRAVPAP
jgi:hypothetical protein